jgi:hypothetical protein
VESEEEVVVDGRDGGGTIRSSYTIGALEPDRLVSDMTRCLLT